MRSAFLTLYVIFYHWVLRPLLFRRSPQEAHTQTLRFLRWLDAQQWAEPILRAINALAFSRQPVIVGGVPLPHPLILAAGFVKGDGFASELEAQTSAPQRNIIPGWRSIPLLVGAVEFGSFTRYPRLGNPGTVIWRDAPTRSTQNRIGLKNPGAFAAATFLASRRHSLPPIFGINIAVSPGVTEPDQECREVTEAVAAFLKCGIRPTWFTLNLSCPNTEDDPGSHQTEARSRTICAAVVQQLHPCFIPLWVKISPDLADEQYRALLPVFQETGVRAVIASNTLGSPAPDGSNAGIGGGQLHPHALRVVTLLTEEKRRHNYTFDIVACGGINDGIAFRRFAYLGVTAAQYWSALIYRGPLAAAVIQQEASQ